MCSIFGYQGKKYSKEELRPFFEETISRGPDMERMEEFDGGVFGFLRLSIMGLNESGMQPFNLNGNKLICNGEIYGFRPIKEELSKEYDFKSESDCEILLPMYEKYGPEMFSKLDAEYALVIYDHKRKSLVAARDPIGIRPLFYGYPAEG
jgi:asparagine synthase (glutamine-hydrolysing)